MPDNPSNTPPKLILDDDWKRSKAPEPAPAPAAASAPGLAVDSDWKAQAQAERDRLAADERKKADAAAPAGERGKMPPADFQALVGTLITQALMYMGAFPDPETGRAIVSPEHAKFNIDLLGVLEEKTKGNLTQTESDELAGALSELRLRFVEISRAVQEAIRARAAKGGGASQGPLNLKF